MSKPKTANTTIRNNNLFCLNCGGGQEIIYPISVDEMAQNITKFNALHKLCKPTWKQPVADQTKSIAQRMKWWLAHGERGISSETMFEAISGMKLRDSNGHPHDPDDFKRCYLLLQAIPEWKSQLHKLNTISAEWAMLVLNWDKLTQMFEAKDKGMYEFLSAVINAAKKSNPQILI